LEFQPLFLLSTSSPSQLYHLSLHDALPICFLAIIFPILYALIDGLGSFADGVYLDELKLIGEESALIAYELTFLFCAILAYLYIKIVKKESFAIFKERDRAYAAILETTGQFFYVFAMAANALIAAPIIAARSEERRVG